MSIVFFFVGFLPCYFLMENLGGSLFGIDINTLVDPLGDKADSMRDVLQFGPILGALVGNFIANVTRRASFDLQSNPFKLFLSHWVAFLLGNVGVLNVGFLLIGMDAVTVWAQSIGPMRLRGFFFLAVPSAGFLGGTASLELLSRLSRPITPSSAPNTPLPELRAFVSHSWSASWDAWL